MIQSYKMVSGYPERTGNGFIGWVQPFAPGVPSQFLSAPEYIKYRKR